MQFCNVNANCTYVYPGAVVPGQLQLGSLDHDHHRVLDPPLQVNLLLKRILTCDKKKSERTSQRPKFLWGIRRLRVEGGRGKKGMSEREC